MIKNKVMMPWISYSFAHKQKELEITHKAVSQAMKVVRCAIDSDINNFLDGDVVKPVFRKYN